MAAKYQLSEDAAKAKLVKASRATLFPGLDGLAQSLTQVLNPLLETEDERKMRVLWDSLTVSMLDETRDIDDDHEQ